jgi:hypothetical protein
MLVIKAGRTGCAERSGGDDAAGSATSAVNVIAGSFICRGEARNPCDQTRSNRLRSDKGLNVNTRDLLLANDNEVKAAGYRKFCVPACKEKFLR